MLHVLLWNTELTFPKAFFHANYFWKGRFIASIRNTWKQLKGKTVCVFSIKKKSVSLETMEGLQVS